MKKNSATYRFLAAFTAFIMLLSIGTPAILYASGFADCDMAPSEHSEHSLADADVTKDDHCDHAAQHESNHSETDTEADTDIEVCSWSFNCSCTTADAAAQSNAIPALSKITAGFTQPVIETLTFSPETKLVNSAQKVFASLYSPPIFLKNSSFLN